LGKIGSPGKNTVKGEKKTGHKGSVKEPSRNENRERWKREKTANRGEKKKDAKEKVPIIGGNKQKRRRNMIKKDPGGSGK